VAICPGFNFAIGNQMKLGSGISRCALNPPRLQSVAELIPTFFSQGTCTMTAAMLLMVSLQPSTLVMRGSFHAARPPLFSMGTQARSLASSECLSCP
jgi:hypothetical protein